MVKGNGKGKENGADRKRETRKWKKKEREGTKGLRKKGNYKSDRGTIK